MTAELYGALAAAHSALTNPGKDGHANYGTYTTLGGALDHIRPVFAAHGLFLMQDVRNDDSHVYVSTFIGHTSGEVAEFGPITWPMPDKVQILGGLVTYLRRYALTAAVGLAGVDDDGQEANESTPRTTAATPPGLRGPAAKAYAADVSAASTTKQHGMIKRLMTAHNLSEAVLPDLVGITTPPDGIPAMTKHEASALIDALMALPKDKPVIRGPLPGGEDPWAIEPVDPWQEADK